MSTDLIIIGGGTAGLGAAREAVAAGASPLLITDGPIGGDCTFTGCVPSKSLIADSHRGTPFPEAMARLQAAVGKAPAAPAERPVAAAPEAPAESAGERPRFGINSLLNRMTGHSAEAETPRAPRQQPTLQAGAAQPAAVEPEAERDEQIEIPAFLRRQAN